MIPEDVKQFVFSNVDSVELLDVLLFLRENRDQAWTAREISEKMRNSAVSVANRLKFLQKLKLLEGNGEAYRFAPHDKEAESLIERLAETYKVRRHQVLELIFSPMKRARVFADAFLLGSNKKQEDENG